MSLNWSHYQKAVFAEAKNGSGNIMINAKAGAGKTTTLIEMADRVNDRGIFVAFNKHIQKELSEKLEGTGFVAKTVHSVGYSTLSYAGYDLKVNGDKYKEIVSDMTEDMSFDTHKKTAKAHLRKLVSLVRMNRIHPEDMDGIQSVASHHGVTTDEVFHLVGPALRRGTQIAKQRGEIDFDDMIWLPLVWNLSFYENKWVFVDEAQDLNACEREMCGRMMRSDGRIVAVGDPNQAIYGFSGADSDSFYQMKKEFDMKEMPLNITYRCPESVVNHVQRLVPDIEARKDAPEGNIEHGSIDDLTDVAEAGDYVLCRTNAPLIKSCIRLVKSGISATVVGRNIKEQLLQIVDIVSFKGLHNNLNEHYQRRADKLEDKDDSGHQLETLRDQIECIKAVDDAFNPSSKNGLKRKIKKLFRNGSKAVKLMTVHKAKGLGNERIIIIEPDLMPLEWRGQKEWEYQQELNIEYIAFTRSKKEVVILE